MVESHDSLTRKADSQRDSPEFLKAFDMAGAIGGERCISTKGSSWWRRLIFDLRILWSFWLPSWASTNGCCFIVSWLCHKSFFFSKMSGKYRGFWMLGVPATLRVFCVDFASATPQGSSRLKYWVWGFTARCNPAFLKPNLTNVIQCKQFGTSEFGLLVCSKNFIWRLVLTYVDLAPAPSSVNWAWLNILNELLGPAKLFCCNNPSFLMFFVGLLTDNKPQASVRCSTNREKPRLVSKTSPWCP